MSPPTILRSSVLFGMTSILAGFIWLVLHNQSQSEYLIYLDFWQLYQQLAENATFNEYLFHHVHTKGAASLAWYLDILFAGGSLKLFHAILLGVMGGALVCLWVLASRLYKPVGVHKAYIISIVIGAMAIWLSPANNDSLTYPMVGSLTSSLLLFVLLYAIVIVKPRTDTPGVQLQGQRSSVSHSLVCLCVAVSGFFSFETFVAAPLFLALDGALRRRYSEALLQIVIVALLITLYFTLRAKGNPGYGDDDQLPVDYLALAYNFIVFLSMHFWMMLDAFNVGQNIARPILLLVSTLQLVALVLFTVSQYSKRSRDDLSSQFAILLAVVGVVSIALAVWLRHTDGFVTAPVRRYIPYSSMFSMGVFFLGAHALASVRGTVSRIAALLVLLSTSGFLAAEAYAFWVRAYNPAGTFAQTRLEMATYAKSHRLSFPFIPGTYPEFDALRRQLRPFLKANALSVFGSAGYRALGHPLPTAQFPGEASCFLVWEQDARYGRPHYTRASFRIDNAPGNGIFLAADSHGTVIGFGFSARLHPLQVNRQSLLPNTSKGEPVSYYYAGVRGPDVIATVPCRRL